MVIARDAQQLGDDPHRQRIGELADDLQPPPARSGLRRGQQLAGDGPDPRLQPGDHPRGVTPWRPAAAAGCGPAGQATETTAGPRLAVAGGRQQGRAALAARTGMRSTAEQSACRPATTTAPSDSANGDAALRRPARGTDRAARPGARGRPETDAAACSSAGLPALAPVSRRPAPVRRPGCRRQHGGAGPGYRQQRSGQLLGRAAVKPGPRARGRLVGGRLMLACRWRPAAAPQSTVAATRAAMWPVTAVLAAAGPPTCRAGRAVGRRPARMCTAVRQHSAGASRRLAGTARRGGGQAGGAGRGLARGCRMLPRCSSPSARPRVMPRVDSSQTAAAPAAHRRSEREESGGDRRRCYRADRRRPAGEVAAPEAAEAGLPERLQGGRGEIGDDVDGLEQRPHPPGGRRTSLIRPSSQACGQTAQSGSAGRGRQGRPAAWRCRASSDPGLD